jgi:SAM-dependent methyltransferase
MRAPNLSPSTFCCAFCDSNKLSKVIDFGSVALAGGFLKPESFPVEHLYPLRVYFCEDCYAVQVVDMIPADVLFDNYFYFSSSIETLREHFKQYAKEVTSRFIKEPSKSIVLEFGCNDGVLLKPLADLGIGTVIGVDPAKNVISTIEDSRVNIVNNFFNEEVAGEIVEKFGRIDLIIANNVYAHIPDIQGATRAIKNALSEDGVFIFEVHYLGNVINEMQYDMIYHEHLYYYSLLSAQKHFERYGLMVFDIKFTTIHAGSIRFYVCKIGSKYSQAVTDEVRDLERRELEQGFHKFETYHEYSDRVANHKEQLIALLENLHKQGARIVGYGASGRANTIIQYCGINHQHIESIIDDAPAKWGFYTPGSHFEINSGALLDSDSPPDYVLIFAWSFYKEISHKLSNYVSSGGKMILPLPNLSVEP